MSSSITNAMDEIELLERVLLRLGNADSDEKLESVVAKFLCPVLIKITSADESVRNKVMEVLNHVNKRLKSRSLIQLPLDPLFEQYKTSDSTFLHNFDIIYIAMGLKRLPIDKQAELIPKVFGCLTGKPESHKDNLLLMTIPALGDLKVPDDPKERHTVIQLDSTTRKQFTDILQDVLLFPYGVTEDADLPPGLCTYSFKRIISKGWKAEELEQHKRGIVKFLCNGVLTDLEAFILLLLASSDTRFSVATPAIAELTKICTALDFTDAQVTAPLYTLFSGNASKIADRKTTPCSARVKQKLLQYLIKSRGKGINTVKGIQIIFEGLFGENTNGKCKVLALKFCENLIKDGPKEILSKVSKVILTGLTKLIGKETNEPIDVQNAAHSAMAQLALTCPDIINNDLKLILFYFNHLTTASSDLHTSIRDALVAMAPAFAWDYNAMETDDERDLFQIREDGRFIMNSQQNLLLAMLADNAQSKLQIVQNVTSIFLVTCFPEYFPPARFLLLLLAGEKTSLQESVTTYLYGVSKKDHINYDIFTSIDQLKTISPKDDKENSGRKRIILPSFKDMTNHTWEMIQKKLSGPSQNIVMGKTELAYSINVYKEILDYLRICLRFSTGFKATSEDGKYFLNLEEYIIKSYQDTEENEIRKYLSIVCTSVAAKRDETNLLCLYELLNSLPELLVKKQMHLLDPLGSSLKDISETLRLRASQIYGLLLAYGLNDNDFNKKIDEILYSLSHQSVESRSGWILVIGHAFNKKCTQLKKAKTNIDVQNWKEFIRSVEALGRFLREEQPLLISASIQSISLIGSVTKLPEINVNLSKGKQDDDKESMEVSTTMKSYLSNVMYTIIKSSSVRARIREDAAICLGCLAIGDGEYYTSLILENFLKIVKTAKDVALNIAISQAIACAICGYDISLETKDIHSENKFCPDETFEKFLLDLIKLVPDPNPHSRQACAVWLLAIIKNCSKRPALLRRRQLLQYAFTELLSDDSDFVQDVASRGLGLVFSLADTDSQTSLASSLVDQLIGGKKEVNRVTEDTELFPEGVLGKTPTGGNMTTYKELCSLASDLNQPEMIYQFMQLANNNAKWNSKLGAAFGLKSIPVELKIQMEPYLGKIIPRLYRYKYDPTPRIQNSMISVWDSIVSDSKSTVENYYWEIMKEILENLTHSEWRIRIACCLAVRDLIKGSTGLRLRSENKKFNSPGRHMEVDEDVPEPELKKLWIQLFRVMDDYHEGTRLAADGTANVLSKVCIVASSSNYGKSGAAVASSMLPVLLDIGVTNVVPEIREISIKTISKLVESSENLIAPHLPSLIPCLLRATGELETPKLSYLSNRVSSRAEDQEEIDSIRAEVAKSHHTMETITKCVRYVDYGAFEKMTPTILELMKSTVTLGTKIACAHFICLVSIRLGEDIQPLVGKYLGACFSGLRDSNATVRKYYASALGHLTGIAKEQSIKNLFSKLEDFYQENPSNKGIPLAIQSINKRHHELLKDYMENVLPLIFFAMHEEITEENKSNVELWKELWIEVSPGDAGIRLNLDAIIKKLEKNLEDASWGRKVQSANAISTMATRLEKTLDNENRLKLINIILNIIGGRTFQGKEKLLQALSDLCKGLDKEDPICEKIIDAAMKECRKEEPQYRTHALRAMGSILEELEADRFEEVYNMIWYLLDKKDLQSITAEKEEETKDFSADERSKRAQIFNKLKEVVCETLGKSWPKNSIETQEKYQIQFVERCSQCLRDSTRQVQVSLIIALGKFLDRLKIFDDEMSETGTGAAVKEKRAKFDQNRDVVIMKICSEVLSSIVFVSGLPHTGLKKESLNVILILIKKLSIGKETSKHLITIKKTFMENLSIFEKDPAPEIRCRLKDIQDKLKNV